MLEKLTVCKTVRVRAICRQPKTAKVKLRLNHPVTVLYSDIALTFTNTGA